LILFICRNTFKTKLTYQKVAIFSSAIWSI